ncbi:MAG TPA: ABC transporter permease [Candidatus Baltobacteraceae bacterium]|nr:ABC transporter permease [Candidatus Baltobacteraceae bacterium]
MTSAVVPGELRATLDEAPQRRSFWSVLFAGPATVAGALVILLVGLCAIFAPLLAPHDPNLQNLALALKPPAWLAGGERAFPLGTDNLGRDILSRVIWGSRVAGIVALSVVLIGGLIGVTAGMIAGYFGGPADDVIARLADIQLAFPFVLLAIAIVGVVGPGLGTIIGVLGVTSWVQYVRVVRAETLSLRGRDFVQAARATGSAAPRILLRHILPNIASSVTVLATFEVARTVILESALSFLGLGAPQDVPSWGTMLADGRQYLDTAWWLGTFPGLAISFTVLGVNLFGDGLRDALDPQSR